ncbi:MAG: metallophosphoesterase [Treponema sp.]|nr:metallophosphoesterase [Treponema sp.]
MNQLRRKYFVFFAVLITLIFGFALTGCGSKETGNSYLFNDSIKPGPVYPNASFAVISDIHVYSHELGASGEAFDKIMFSDRKLLLDSIDLLDYAINEIIASGVDFVIIPGDLTKDGELINHEIASQRLRKFTEADISVFVIPGNHDVNCPKALRYIEDRTERVPNISEEQFAQFYSDFGYGSAIYRDTNSLSYVAEPVEGLWLLAIDSTRHRENDPDGYPHVSGRILQGTADWMGEVLMEADKRGKAVMAMMHHGFFEHWKGQSKLHPVYIVQDFSNFSKFLASWNVRAGFTGHYHAQDITLADYNAGFMYDIQTGSLVTAPCPIRYVNINSGIMNIRTDFIIDKLYPETDFAKNAHAFVKQTVMLEASNVLRRYRVSEKDIAIIVDAVGDAFTAHYSGDEDPSLRPDLDKSKLSLWGRFILSQQQYALDGLWEDLYPADNNVSIQL